MITDPVERILSKSDIYWRYAPTWYRRIWNHDIDKYDAPCDPYKIEWVDPDRIQEITRRPRAMKYNVIGEVRDGNWDIRDDFQFTEKYEKEDYIYYKYPTMRFEDSVFYQSLRARFVDGLDWDETEYVQTELNRIQEGKTGWGGSSTREELLSHCASVDLLYNTIKQSGYKDQVEIGDARTLMEARLNEILVDIGRDGQLLYVDSRHRLAISKILDLDSIPVTFAVRHSEWAEFRDKVYNGIESASHPDLRSI